MERFAKIQQEEQKMIDSLREENRLLKEDNISLKDKVAVLE